MKNLMMITTILSTIGMASSIKSQELKLKIRNQTGINFILQRPNNPGGMILRSGEERNITIPFNDMQNQTGTVTTMGTGEQHIQSSNTYELSIVRGTESDQQTPQWGSITFHRTLFPSPVAGQPTAKNVGIALNLFTPGIVYQMGDETLTWNDATPLRPDEIDSYNATVTLKGQTGQESTVDVAASHR